MRGPGSKATTLPEPSGLKDDSFSDSLTSKGKAAFAEFARAAERHARRRALAESVKAIRRKAPGSTFKANRRRQPTA